MGHHGLTDRTQQTDVNEKYLLEGVPWLSSLVTDRLLYQGNLK